MKEDELTLEKLRIAYRMDTLDSTFSAFKDMYEKDCAERSAFRKDIQTYMAEQRVILLGDAKSVKGLATRVTELETVRGIHSKFIWTVIPVTVALFVKNLWDAMSGGHK